MPASWTVTRGRQPQQLIVTIFALYGRGPDASIAVSELIRLLARLDVDEPAVRSALSRLKKRGVVTSARKAGAAVYVLSPSLEAVFREGDERIFAPRRSSPGDRWLLAAFSVPESQRHLRHQIRKILGRRGFGTVGSGLWIAPEISYPHVRRELERDGLLEFVEFFAADHLTTDHLAGKVGTWWDLPTLADLYDDFCAQFEPVRLRWESVDPSGSPDRAFADYVLVVTAWRRLPFLDPGLPLDYLPADWQGLAAEQLFADLHDRLAAAARRHATSVIGAAARPG